MSEPGRRLARLACALALLAAAPSRAGDASWRGLDERSDQHNSVYTRKSFYVEMRDGTPIAVDLWLPEGAGESAKLPAILRQTRYWRSAQLRLFVRPFRGGPEELAKRFLARGYAWLDVDVRGSGASGGVQRSLWADDEVEDGGQLVDWIVRQPWSNGRVGALGDSYDGTAAELLLAAGRPAVRAVAPRFSLFDAYTDIAFPGGVRLVWFTDTWGRLDAALDRGELRRAFPWWVPLFVIGPRPVDGPGAADALAAAQRAHADNFDVAHAAREVEYRDDVAPELGGSTKDFSPCCGRRARIEASGAAVFGTSGWWDGAYPRAAARRFRSLANPGGRLLLGPWNHGGDQALDPLQATRASEFDHAAELLRFFDFHLKGVANGWEREPPVHYFTTGESRWKSAASWPPPAHVQPLWLAEGHALASRAPAEAAAADEWRADPESRTGTSSRWRGLTVPTWTEYGDRADADQHNLVYDSAALEADLEVTGHPVLHLWLRADGPDAAVFAYLEDVDPKGRVGYATEGWLRARDRKLGPDAEAPYALLAPYHSFARADAAPLAAGERTELVFDLLPLSHLFRRGHRIRLSLATSDRDQFDAVAGAASTLWLERSAGAASRLELPVADRSP
ncbi:MAG TPA: CocE/NonD family hydrolase [Myxococcota bacterium]|nr:CocE/NonD family hydrolase [Myxococcota bacterium]